MPRIRLAVPILAALALSVPAPAQTAADLAGLTENAAVSVREGDAWSPATFVKREGRKYLVKYDDGTEEWVPAERLKPGGASGGGAATKPAAPAANKPKYPVFVRGDKVQIKDNAFWKDATVINRRGEWVLIEYVGWNGWREWAEPWRLRKPGSDYDFKGRISNPRVRNNEGPPRPTPGDAPDADGKGGPPKNDPFSPPPTGFPVTDAKRDGKTLAPVAASFAYVPAAGPKLAPSPVVLPPLSDFFSKYGDPEITGTTAMVPVINNGPTAKGTGIVRVNLTAATALGVTMNAASLPLAISPSGNLIAARSNGFHSRTNGRFDVYKINGQETAHVVSFTPDAKSADIRDAFFVDEKTVLIAAGDVLGCWDVATATNQWQMPINSDANLARSADGKTVAVSTDEGVALVDIAAGSVVGVLDGEPVRQLSLSADGRRVLGLRDGVLSVWELEKGTLLYRMGLPPGLSGSLTAIDTDFALIGPYLFSLARKTPVWKYEGDGPTVAAGGRVFTVVGGARSDKSRTLANAVLPQPSAQQAAKLASDAVMLLKPGMTVSLDLQQEAPEPQRQAAVAALTRQLQKAGIKIAANQTVRIVARTEVGKQETREYEKRRGFDRSKETVTITNKVTTLSIQSGNTVCWSVSRNFSNDPGMIVHIEAGKTVQDQANKAVSTNDWIANTSIPTLVAAPVNLDTLPVSRWALGGVKDK